MHLAFFSGNEVFWKTRWETSIDGSGNRRPHAGLLQGDARQRQDRPAARSLDRHLARPALQPARRRRPARERADRQLFTVNDGATTAIRVPAADGKMRFWRNTSVATLAAGPGRRRSPTGTLGYEWDEDLDNGFRPPA